MSNIFGFIVVIFIISYILSSRIKIASEHQRFAVYALGKYMGLKGPGLLFKWSGGETKWLRLSIGDRLELIAPKIAKINEFSIPVDSDEKVTIGSVIRVVGFKGSAENSVVQTMLDSDQRRKVKCENCGHEMLI
jgi:hypothetical protein